MSQKSHLAPTAAEPSPAAEQGTGAQPFVTVAMPVFNEERFIAASLDQVLAQDYPLDRLEVIVADGMSTDRTREIVASYSARHPQVRLIDNPARFRASALNAAIRQAKGDVIICIDGHCEVASDFVRQDIQLLAEHPDAWLVGGPVVHVGRNTFDKAVAIAMSHPFGVGMATHRFHDFEGYAEGAGFPAIRRWVFDRIGMFDEVMVRTEDDELHYRIAQAGGRAYISPRVRYQYFVRDTPKKLFQQYQQYGFWRIPVIRKHKRPTTVRQVIPLAFFLTMIVLAIVGVAVGQPLVALALPAAYVAALALIGLSVVRRAGFKVACLVPVAVATMHVAYAWGMGFGWFAALFRPRAFDPRGTMSQQKR